jgi:hypothetical protein
MSTRIPTARDDADDAEHLRIDMPVITDSEPPAWTILLRFPGRKPLHASIPAVSIGMTTDTGLSHIFPNASVGIVEIDATADLTLPVRYSRAVGPEDRSSSDNQWFDWGEEDTKLEVRQARRALIAEACDQLHRGAAPASLVQELRWIDEQLEA